MTPDRLAKLIILVACACLIAADVTFARDALLVPRQSLLDRQIRWLKRDRVDPDFLIAGIDDATIQAGAFNRAAHAQVIQNLSAAGARAIFYDILFEEDREVEVDRALADSARASQRCIFASAYKLSDEGFQPPKLIEPLEKVIAAGLASRGIINIGTEATRQETILSLQLGDQHFLSAATAILARLNHQTVDDVKVLPDRVIVPPARIPVHTTRQKEIGDQELSLTQMTTVFSAPVTGPEGKPAKGQDRYRLVSYLELLNPKSPIFSQLSGAIVFVGDNTKSETDVLRTPVGPMKGVEVHAQILDTLRHGPHLETARPGSRLFWLDVALQLVFAYLMCSMLLRRPTPGWMLLTLGASLFVAVAVYLAIGLEGWILNLPLLVLELGLTFVLCVLLRVRESIRVLSSFIPREIALQLLGTGRSEVSRRRATVIVTDIRGYTSLSETKTPKQILSMLNEYHTETVQIFERFGGSVLNYQGDAQIILFGYPKKLRDPARSAVLASLETSRAIDRLRSRWGLTKEQTFDVGAGVCTGQVSVGELGSAGHAEYTVVGETVRRCHKVQSMSNKLNSNVLVDEETMVACRVRPQLNDLGAVELDGLPDPVKLYGVPAEPDPIS